MKNLLQILLLTSGILLVFSACEKSSKDSTTTTADKCGGVISKVDYHRLGGLFSDSLTAPMNYGIIYMYDPVNKLTTINFYTAIMADICTFNDSSFVLKNTFTISDTAVKYKFFKMYVNGTWHLIYGNKYMLPAGGYLVSNDTTFKTKPLNNDGPAAADFLWSFSFPSQTTRQADIIYLANRVSWDVGVKYPKYIGK